MSAQDNLEEIKKQLLAIKKHGRNIAQDDAKLFDLFIDSYRNNYMDLDSFPILTAEEIKKALAYDSRFQTSLDKTQYNLEEAFYIKWLYWTEAFEKGFKTKSIKWV